MLVIGIRLNRYFSHIVFQLILHLIFTMAFGSIVFPEPPHQRDDDSILYLWGKIVFIYNMIVSGCSFMGIITIEIMLKKKFSEQISKRVLVFIRFCVIVSQTLYFLTCVAMAVMFKKRDDFSEATKPLTDLALAYTIIGIWYIILGGLYLASGHCLIKNMSNIQRADTGNTAI